MNGPWGIFSRRSEKRCVSEAWKGRMQPPKGPFRRGHLTAPPAREDLPSERPGRLAACPSCTTAGGWAPSLQRRSCSAATWRGTGSTVSGSWREHLSPGEAWRSWRTAFSTPLTGTGTPGCSRTRGSSATGLTSVRNRRLGALQDAMERSGLGEARSEQRREFPCPSWRSGMVFSRRCDRMDILRDGSALLFT